MKRLLIALILLVGTLVPAAEPPQYINYQGVLRDSTDKPVPDGGYDMVFGFYDAKTLGNLLLTDSHTAADPPPVEPVTVTGGLFSAHLGRGVITSGVHATLSDVFANEAEVWLEIEVGGETLTPRVQVISAGYALNAGRLNGRTASEFIDTSTTEQEKEGSLKVHASTWYTGYYTRQTSDNSAYVYLAPSNRGVDAHGNEMGGFFSSIGASGWGKIGFGDIGLQAWGSQTGGYFNKVGIGTDTPSVPLEVVGDASVDGLTVTGSVGIGTSIPSVELEVAGDVRVTGDLVLDSTSGGIQFPDDTIQSTACAGGFGEPDWTHEEVVAQGLCEDLWHFLGGDAALYVVYMDGRDGSGDPYHQAHYGGMLARGTNGALGAYWYDLTEEKIRVCRYSVDAQAETKKKWWLIRVRIWKNQ